MKRTCGAYARVAILFTWVAWAVACSLNPQPIPPGAATSAPSDGGGATEGTDIGDEFGMHEGGASSAPKDAEADANGAQTGVESEGGPGDAADAGDAGDAADAMH
jgi:hypothetical protein